MAKFKGVLDTPIAPLRGSLLDTEESLGRETTRILTERLSKVPALAEHYGITGKIDLPQLLHLVLQLASEVVPGFMVEGDDRLNRRGAPIRRDDHFLFLLLARVEALRLDGLDDKTACQKIAAEDDPTLAGAANKSRCAARGKTLQNSLARARRRPFASALRQMTKDRGMLSSQEYDAIRFGAVDAASFIAIESIIAKVKARSH
ncbi:hypothetical protein AB8A20_08130 [Tardiphaga sp. 604_B6_N1_1]|uniref:hypothetical protein n=1 Tax=unclassified Tardiphaga TaxID=2631404 RepID=UPI003F281E69